MASTNLQQRPSEVARWDPFEDLEYLQQQLAQIFPTWARMPARPMTGSGTEAEFAPLADVEETNDAFVVEIELAGVNKDDINVEVSGRRLTVTGERKERRREGTLRRRTRTVGRFRYEMVLPIEVDDTKVEASLNEGVLSIRIPKGAAEKPKRVTVH